MPKIDNLMKNNKLFIYCEKKRDAEAILSFLQDEVGCFWRCEHNKSYLAYFVEGMGGFVALNTFCKKKSWKWNRSYTCYQICSNGEIIAHHLSWCAEHKYPIVYAKDFRALINR